MGLPIKGNFAQACHASKYYHNHVKVSTQLTYNLLRDLCNGKILAIRIPGYYDTSACKHILTNLETEQELNQKYDNAPELGLYRLGMSFFETRFNKKLLDTYFLLSDKFNQAIEDICTPYTSPLDKLVNDLEKIWPSGTEIQTLDNKPMMPGLVRTFLENQLFPPHQDMLSRDCPDLPQAEHPFSQLTANIYLKNFAEGGELEVWDYAPDDEEVKALYSGTHDFIDRNKLPMDSLKLRPEAGELIIVQCSKLHSVLPGFGGKRVAFSCFSAYRGEDQPLTYWI